ncbi:phosphotransferase family protein [Deinococcus navajonensis]|uniref:Phosphotransferase family protein n=1 Tax=Deinococcus navajonensis TaxID=309884 RepID=A0ABV8XP25_9DEIO
MRLARLTPELAPWLNLPFPRVEHAGVVEDRAFVGYRLVPGEAMTKFPREQWDRLDGDDLARQLARFFLGLHTFDVRRARAFGFPASHDAFGMREDTWTAGEAAELYQRDLMAFRGLPDAARSACSFLQAALERHLHTLRYDGVTPVLLHGEVSVDHILLDPTTLALSGVIDLNGAFIGRPARDFLYLYETLGSTWTASLLKAYGRLDVAMTLEELHFLSVWHTVQRLLWARQHGWLARAEQQRRVLETLIQQRSAQDGA